MKGIYAKQRVGFAGMAKLVDALDLGSSGATHKSSSLFTRTKKIPRLNRGFFIVFFYYLVYALTVSAKICSSSGVKAFCSALNGYVNVSPL